tara:strand:+ start:339 stop:719 length:381 start_codon:yes stop_codon:yes gene_type:complete
MKKLLPILICLFVSYDVRSKEYLTGLQLLCDYENYSEGFNFFESEIEGFVDVIFLNKKTGNLSIGIGHYFTNSSEITIFVLGESNREIKINRQNPKSCEKFSGDLKSFLKKKTDEIKNKLKSNQKF